MANKGYPISIATTTIADMANALIDKFGAGVTIHYQTTASLIFSCSAITNKVIKIALASSIFTFYYGDSYTSTTTIVNQVTFQGNAGGGLTKIQMVLGDNFFLFNALSGAYTCLTIIAKLTNGKFIVHGFTAYGNPNSHGLCIGKNTTDNIDITLVTLERDFTGTNEKLYKQNLIIKKVNGGIELNADGSPAYIDGLVTVSANIGSLAMVVTTNSIFTSNNLLMIGAIKALSTSLYAEW